MKKNVYIITHNKVMEYVPIVNYYLLEHYDHYGKHRDAYSWGRPIMTKTFEQADSETFVDAPPDVIGISVYIWNRNELFEFARQVKLKYPDCVVVAGGPQPEYEFFDDFWQQYSYVDYVVPAQGEHVFTDFLDRLHEGTERETQEIAYWDGERAVVNPALPQPRTRVWDSRWLIAYEDMFTQDVKEHLASGRQLQMTYETSRGCPYGCIYCDWGGGTYTKVRKKPLDVVKQELDIIAKLQTHTLKISDANFGIVEEDVEIAQYLVDLNKRTGYPKKFTFDAPKNKSDRLERIYHITIPAGIIEWGHLALQDSNEDVLRTIDRQNIHWESQVEMAKRLGEQYNFAFFTDIMLGLPGQTVETWKETMLDLSTTNITMSVNHVQVLPNSPMAKRYYKDLYKIRWDMFYFGNIYLYYPKDQDSYQWCLDNGIHIDTLKSDDTDDVCLITGSHTFDEDGLATMEIISGMHAGIISSIGGYFEYFYKIMDAHGIRHKQFKGLMIDKLVDETVNPTTNIGKELQKIKNHYRDWLTKRVYKRNIDIDPDWHVDVTPSLATKYMLFLHYNEVYQFAKDILRDRIPEEVLDLTVTHQKNCFLGIDYDPRTGRQWQSIDFDIYGKTGQIQILNYNMRVFKVHSANNRNELIRWPAVENTSETYMFLMCCDDTTRLIGDPDVQT